MSASPLIASTAHSPPGSPALTTKRRRTELADHPELSCGNPDKCHLAMDAAHHHHHHNEHHEHPHDSHHHHHSPSPSSRQPATAASNDASDPGPKEQHTTSRSTALHEAVRAVQQDPALSESQQAERIHLLFAEARQRALSRDADLSRHPTGRFPGKGASKGCEHYSRNCWLKAACCAKYYPCRRCHDRDEDHEIDRHATELVACVACGDEDQPVSNKCRSCSVVFAKYYCGACKFFDDSEGKEVYHCHGCGICRVGKGLGIDQHHCDGCGNCVPIDTRHSHPCRERSLDANCPICTHYLATSTEPVVFMRCGHTMHTECLEQHTASGYTCPICNKCLTDMGDWYRELDGRVSRDIIPPEYANRMSRILCHDCGDKTVIPFHFVYHKCATCGGYNTRILEQFDREERTSAMLPPMVPTGPVALALEQAPQLEEAT